MEREEVVNLRFPVYFSSVYSSNKKVERVELILEIYSSLSSFFNAVVADVVSDLVQDGRMVDYEIEQDEDEDQIVYRKFARPFRIHIDDREFGHRTLDDLGLSATEVRTAMKKLAFNLVEDTLGTCHSEICEEAAERKKRLSRVLALSAVDEKYGENGLPVRFTIEATISLDQFKRISQ
jgi:hypothetical protein